MQTEAHSPHLARNLSITYVVLAAALSIFAIVPSMALGEPMTLAITMFWMLLLAGIVATYAVTVATFGADEH